MIKNFFLLGQDAGKSGHEIRTDHVHDLETLRVLIASEFHIIEADSITFQDKASGVLTDLEAIFDSQESVGILVDGHQVRDPTGPTGLPIAGAYYEVFPDHIGNHARMFKHYGDVIKYDTYGKPNYLTCDPRVAGVAFAESPFFTKSTSNPNHPLHAIQAQQALFLCDTNEAWSLAHKFIAPAMNPKAIRHYHPLMQSAVQASYPVFDELDNRGEAWNVYTYMLKLASQTIGEFALGMEFHHFDSVDAPDAPLVTAIAKSLSLNKKLASRGEWYSKLPFGDAAELARVRDFVLKTLDTAIDNCPKGGDEDLPIKDAALQAACVFDFLNRAVDEKGNKLPRDLIIPNMLPVVGAGFVTTSSLLSWLLYSMVTYEGTQDKLLQEFVDAGINHDTKYNPDLTESLHYLDKFIKETQRIHNPSFQPARVTKVDCVVPGGYSLPAGAVLIPALYAIHSNPKLWSNAEKFDPDRWDTDEVKNRPKNSYIPFATGPRSCIGFNFALGEIKVLLPSLVYRYEFTREGEGTIEYDPEYQLIRPTNLYVRARKRTAWPSPSKAQA